jgi:hypothetical protein
MLEKTYVRARKFEDDVVTCRRSDGCWAETEPGGHVDIDVGLFMDTKFRGKTKCKRDAMIDDVRRRQREKKRAR